MSLSLVLSDSSTSTKDLLLSVFTLSSLLSGWFFTLFGQTVSNQSVSWFEFFQVSNGVVDQTETSGFTTTVLSSETENRNSVLVNLVNGGQFFTQFSLGNVSSVWMQNVNDELTSSKKRVGDNLSGSDSNCVTLYNLVSITGLYICKVKLPWNKCQTKIFRYCVCKAWSIWQSLHRRICHYWLLFSSLFSCGMSSNHGDAQGIFVISLI